MGAFTCDLDKVQLFGLFAIITAIRAVIGYRTITSIVFTYSLAIHSFALQYWLILVSIGSYLAGAATFMSIFFGADPMRVA